MAKAKAKGKACCKARARKVGLVGGDNMAEGFLSGWQEIATQKPSLERPIWWKVQINHEVLGWRLPNE